MFILEPTSKQKLKSSVLSAAMLIRLLGVNKTKLLKNIKRSIPLSQIDLIIREKINGSWMPLSFTSFLIRSLYLSLGSQSPGARKFLRQNFFHTMEEVEDCVVTTQIENQPQALDYDPFHKNAFSREKDGDIFAVRFKAIMKRVE